MHYLSTLKSKQLLKSTTAQLLSYYATSYVSNAGSFQSASLISVVSHVNIAQKFILNTPDLFTIWLRGIIVASVFAAGGSLTARNLEVSSSIGAFIGVFVESIAVNQFVIIFLNSFESRLESIRMLNIYLLPKID
jgi:hypothetical protein